MYNILEHQLVPKHDILSTEEKRAVLETFHVSEHQLPRILDSDPVVKKLCAQPGDVLKITRKSQTAGESIYYRIVVAH